MEKISKHKERNNVLEIGSRNLNTENWKVFHPNGKHMFTCGEKKSKWYLDRDLARQIGTKSIELTFDPKGYGFEDNEDFGRSIRETRCVVNGLEVDLQRHHIVPYCYRTYFPVKYKSKNHHDVVLIHYLEHSKYEQLANDFKDYIAELYGVKTISEFNTEYTLILRDIGKNNSILMNILHSFFKFYGKLPEDVKLEKLKFISEHTNIPYEMIIKFNYIQLYKLYLVLKSEHAKEIKKFKTESRKYYDHGYHVVQKLDTEEKIEEFVKLWRNHFIKTMNPKYMPNGWSVDFRIRTKL